MQCRKCQRQTGIRAGTVMEKSRLGLLPWFRAIKALMDNFKSSTAQLTAVTGIRRDGTVRRMARKIRGAMESTKMSSRLAGLDRVRSKN